MTFTQKYPNLTWCFTCRYYVLHNSAKTCCIALLLLCLSANIYAQTYEFTTVLPLDKLLIEEGNDTLAAFFPLVYKNRYDKGYDEYHFSSNDVLSEKIHHGQWFFDKKLTDAIKKPYYEYVDYPDTMITYDPETYEEKVSIVTFCEWFLGREPTILRHIITYNPATQSIKCQIPAFAPQLKRSRDDYKTTYYLTVWTALADTQRYENASLSDTALTWAKMAKIYLKTNEFERNNTDTDFVTALYNDIKQGKWQVYNANLRGEEPLLSKIALDSILYKHPETINTLDTISHQYKEMLTGKKGFDIADCTYLRLHIIYFFDAKRFRLGCRIERIAFMRSNKGYKEAVFWIKPK
jgi:Gliding motility associated protein GldN